MKHVVGFSGGIDSQACALWVRERYPAEDIVLMNSDAGGWEHELTVKFIKWYNENIFPVTVVNAKIADMWATPGFAETKGLCGTDRLTFEKMIELKGRSPSRRSQFCTEKLKLIPARRWCEHNIPDGDFERYTGLRRDESSKRRETPLREWDEYFDCYVNHPLVEWTKQQCFDYVIGAGEQVNPLYALGFNRVGCAPCINSSKSDILQWNNRFPDVIDKVRGVELRIGRTFFAPCVPGKAINTIDEVVEWSKTEHGGKQYSLGSLCVLPSCESKFGLCE
jgi:3'-phosphoadenosine 5'-phosphosulfate sulfotransferase (PAPS reductase)/FAD synthetase